MATGRPKKEFDKKTLQNKVLFNSKSHDFFTDIFIGWEFAKSESIKKKAGVFQKNMGILK